jgi:hypothetical protein
LFVIQLSPYELLKKNKISSLIYRLYFCRHVREHVDLLGVVRSSILFFIFIIVLFYYGDFVVLFYLLFYYGDFVVLFYYGDFIVLFYLYYYILL